jgi:Predicted hydrolases or acyltransferases (alpha/beta hydrolase superfamily)
MPRKNRLPLHLTLLVVLLVPPLSLAQTQAPSSTPPKSGYAPINGLKMYYEIHGEGQPLVLLHGSFLDIDMAFGQLIPELSKTRKVIALEFQAHGRTADIDRPISFASLADDVAALLKYLHASPADIFGYSLGGGVALQVAFRHPESVRKLVICSAPFKSDGWSPETRAALEKLTPEILAATPLKKEYDRLAPDPGHWAQMVNKVKQIGATPYDFSAQAKSIEAPTLIIVGDSDGILPEHIAEMFRIRGGGANGDLGGHSPAQLAVFPATSHVGVIMHTDWLLAILPAFLDSQAN